MSRKYCDQYLNAKSRDSRDSNMDKPQLGVSTLLVYVTLLLMKTGYHIVFV